MSLKDLLAAATSQVTRRRSPASTPPAEAPPAEQPPAVPVAQITIVKPTEEQRADGVRRLRECESVWKRTSGLLVMDPGLAAIVRLREAFCDDIGFGLALDVEECLTAPESERTQPTFTVGCVWNQPYLEFDGRGVHAPYSFYLHFDAEGVARVRQLWAALSPHFEGSEYQPIRQLRGCFLIGGRYGMSEAAFQQMIRDLSSKR